MVSGPYIDAPSNGTDLHTDTRANFRENEPAIDYAASVFCALAGFAGLPENSREGCKFVARDPFEGRP
jgi:hypothetical protein